MNILDGLELKWASMLIDEDQGLARIYRSSEAPNAIYTRLETGELVVWGRQPLRSGGFLVEVTVLP